ncbi:MAG TPA: endolytic transglycosylase MltG, partial [Pilimelia sp.]|nr:endolytic transglycosylase MltG [Pilimelia sp.]
RNPYNRKLRGLPPTPIDNPGAAALKAAMDPPVGDWLYFVAIDKQGNSAFATTLAEHERNQAVARRNGVL